MSEHTSQPERQPKGRLSGLRKLADKAGPVVGLAINHAKQTAATKVNDALATQRAILEAIDLWDKKSDKVLHPEGTVLSLSVESGQPTVYVQNAGVPVNLLLQAHYAANKKVTVEVEHVRGPNSLTIRFQK